MAGLRAGAMGLPFLPARGILGSSYMQIRQDFNVIENPYNGDEKIVLVPAITPSASVFHAFQSDRDGNVLADPPQESKLLAQATTGPVIATVEEVVDELTPDINGTFIPGHLITAVIHAPGGAHPTSCRGFYRTDAVHVQEYLASAKCPDQWTRYLDRYVYQPRDYSQYLQAVGRVKGEADNLGT